MSGYLNLSANLTSIEVSSISLPESDEPIIRIGGFVDCYPAMGMHISPEVARKFASDLIEAADKADGDQ